MIRSTIVIGVLVIGGGYFSGAFGGHSWSRTVGKPQAEVMKSLETLDVRDDPGAPGTDPSRSGGVPSIFKLARTDHSMSWIVMSGDKVATTMTADFEPIDNGKDTRVTAHVERGDAPDDFVAPAFRSNGLTLGLFSMALEGKLEQLTNPGNADPATCNKLFETFAEANHDAGLEERPTSLAGGFSQSARSIMHLQAFDAERRRLGCPDPRFSAGSDTLSESQIMAQTPAPASVTPERITPPSIKPPPLFQR